MGLQVGPQDTETPPCEQEEGWGSGGCRAGWSAILGDGAPGAGPPEPRGVCRSICLREKNTSLQNTGPRLAQSVGRCRPDGHPAGGCVLGGGRTVRPWLAQPLS